MDLTIEQGGMATRPDNRTQLKELRSSLERLSHIPETG
jgi:hypothetical protein